MAGHDNIIRPPNEKALSELDEAWETALAEAKRRAHAAGRADIARYLAVRAENDLLRGTAIEWLTSTVTALAADANRRGAVLQIEFEDAHSFRVGSATMVGTKLTLRHGVRALSIESGWPRTPRDGIVRGNGLACANLKHFGRPRANTQLLLARSANGVPQWQIVERTDKRAALSEDHLRTHISLLLAEN